MFGNIFVYVSRGLTMLYLSYDISIYLRICYSSSYITVIIINDTVVLKISYQSKVHDFFIIDALSKPKPINMKIKVTKG